MNALEQSINSVRVAATAADGMKAEDVVARLEGIRCGGKATSCPDQLSRALRQALEQGA